MLAWFLVVISISLGLAKVVLMLILVGSLSLMSVSAHFDSAFTELCEIVGGRPTRRGFVDVVLRRFPVLPSLYEPPPERASQ